tara:strand:+ start:6399 stop:6512 length:114 start_codon:yes stop_codon:yes gene_type:complete
MKCYVMLARFYVERRPETKDLEIISFLILILESWKEL